MPNELRSNDARLARLPEWAQQEIRLLRMRLDEERAVNRAHRGGTRSRVSYGYAHGDGAGTGPKGFLDDGDHIDFYLCEPIDLPERLPDTRTPRLTVRLVPGAQRGEWELDVNAGGFSLFVLPRSSNVCRLAARRE